jgi:hypothetical protein
MAALAGARLEVHAGVALDFPERVGQPVTERDRALRELEQADPLRRRAPTVRARQRVAQADRAIAAAFDLAVLERDRERLAEPCVEARGAVAVDRVARTRALGPQLGGVGGAEDLAPERAGLGGLPAARARREPRAQRAADRVRARARECVARRRVARERRGDRLGETRPEPRAVRLAATPAREIALRHHRVLRAQRRGTASELEVEHVGRQQRVGGRERARPVRRAVVVDDRVEVVHALAGAAPQTRPVEGDRGDRAAVARGDLVGERGRVGGDRGGELVAQAVDQARARAAHVAILTRAGSGPGDRRTARSAPRARDRTALRRPCSRS